MNIPTRRIYFAVCLAAATSAHAAVTNWNVSGSAAWNVAGSWNNGVPTVDDEAGIFNAAAIANINDGVSAVADYVSMARGTLQFNSSGNVASLTLSGAVNAADASTNGNMLIGVGNFSTAVVNLASAGLSTLTVIDNGRALIVGNGGNTTFGTLNQLAAGATVIADTLIVGNTNGVTGVYNFSAGTTTVNLDLRIGQLNNGNPGTNGTANLSGTADLTVGDDLIVSNISTGKLKITGSNVSIGVGATSGDTGSYVQGALGALEFIADAAGVTAINVTGFVSLNGLLTVDISAVVDKLSAMVLIANDAADAVGGSFTNVAFGTRLLAGNGYYYTLVNNYGGNDVALVFVPAPAALPAGLALLAAAFPSLRCSRRRLAPANQT